MFQFSNRTYDVIRHLVRVVLPATGALYFTLSEIWGLPKSTEVVGTLAVVATFLGLALGISDKEYERSGRAYDGEMVVSDKDDESGKLFSLNLNKEPEELEGQKSIKFKVMNDHGDHGTAY